MPSPPISIRGPARSRRAAQARAASSRSEPLRWLPISSMPGDDDQELVVAPDQPQGAAPAGNRAGIEFGPGRQRRAGREGSPHQSRLSGLVSDRPPVRRAGPAADALLRRSRRAEPHAPPRRPRAAAGGAPPCGSCRRSGCTRRRGPRTARHETAERPASRTVPRQAPDELRPLLDDPQGPRASPRRRRPPAPPWRPPRRRRRGRPGSGTAAAWHPAPARARRRIAGR